MHPTADNINFLNRSETWREAQRAFAAACEHGCSERQHAAMSFCEGEAARLEGDRGVARRAFERASATDPTWGLPHLGMGMVDLDDAPDRVEQQAREAYAKDPSLWIALGLEGSSFARQGNYVAAIQEFIEERRVAREALHEVFPR